MIVGIDEVGRGPWAGPLVMGAVVLGGATIEGLTDSKKLSKKRREELDEIIRREASAVGLGWVEAIEIDELGLSMALALACQRALEAVDMLEVAYHEIIIDGTVNFLKDTSKGRYVTTMKKADLLVPSVSAASIVAKVARDQYMAEQDVVYPGYHFASHVGYGTAEHVRAIDKLGVTPLHRLSFAPLSKYRKDQPESQQPPKHVRSRLWPFGKASSSSAELASAQTTSKSEESSPNTRGLARSASEAAAIPSSVSSTGIGNLAEDAAAEYLVSKGHTILERNWKTKYCEIDIVSQLGDAVYFTEVKYRRQPRQGGGLAAITPKKLKQMEFAAKVYAKYRDFKDVEQHLAAISLTGEPPVVELFVLAD